MWILIGLLTMTVYSLFIFLLAFPLTTESLVNKMMDSRSQASWDDITWETYCQRLNISWPFYLLSGLNAIFFFYPIIYFLFFRSCISKRPRIVKLQKFWWWILAPAAWIDMWISVALFRLVRPQLTQKNQDQDAMGLNSETEWTFGQVLSLATWAPVVIEFVHVYIKGPEKALTERMSPPFVATPIQVRETNATTLEEGHSPEEEESPPTLIKFATR